MKFRYILLLSLGVIALFAVGVLLFFPELTLQGNSNQSLDEIAFDFEQSKNPDSIPVDEPEDSLQPPQSNEVSENAAAPYEPDSFNDAADEDKSTDAHPEPFQKEGTLTMVVDGNVLGEEEYHLTRTLTGDFQLVSTGYFQFKVVLVNAKFNYQQAIAWHSDSTPRLISFKVDGPLGFGNRHFDISFMLEEPYRTASITSQANGHEDVRLPDGELAVQGTFSSYAIFPYLLGERESADFQVIIANGFSPNNSAGATSNEFALEHLGSATIRTENSQLDVEEYRFVPTSMNEDSTSDSFRVLFENGELIGLYAKSDDERAQSFQIYRSDLFPNGFEIESGN